MPQWFTRTTGACFCMLILNVMQAHFSSAWLRQDRNNCTCHVTSSCMLRHMGLLAYQPYPRTYRM